MKDVPVSRKPVPLERAVQQAVALKKAGEQREVQAYPLSESDVRQIIPTLEILAYPDLLKATHIDQVLDPKGRLLLLYLTEDENTGHWICLLKRRGTKVIEFFDPYGNKRPDDQGKWITSQKRRQFGQESKHLTKLLNSSPYKIMSNAFPFQSETMNVNTCGRHCVTRLYFKHLALPEYIRMVESTGLDADEFVTGFTYNLIGK